MIGLLLQEKDEEKRRKKEEESLMDASALQKKKESEQEANMHDTSKTAHYSKLGAAFTKTKMIMAHFKRRHQNENTTSLY